MELMINCGARNQKATNELMIEWKTKSVMKLAAGEREDWANLKNEDWAID